jgi:3',5'-cyclic-AMP phosphodiesterase
MNPISPVVFVLPGDLHLTKPGLSNHDVALWVVDQVNDLIKPDFVQFVGDNVQDAEPAQFDLFLALAGRLRHPWFALVGDHDAQGDPTAARFRAHVCDPIGSLELRGFRFIRLNTQEGQRTGLSSEQIEWFRTELEAAGTAGQRSVVFQHNYPYQIWEDFDGPGLAEWRALVQTYPVTAHFCGHTHYWQVANDGRNVFVATRSIGDPEGGEPGYTLAFLHGDDLGVTYRCVNDTGPLVLITHPREVLLSTGPAHVVHGLDRVRARVWSSTPVSEVRYRIDDGPWMALEAEGSHDWGGTLLGDQLSKGMHQLTVQAMDCKWNVGSQEIIFAVDPTGRYTAVPSVRPVVTATQFC